MRLTQEIHIAAFCVALAIATLSAFATASAKDPPRDSLEVIRSLPVGEQELSEAFAAAARRSCRPIAPNISSEVREISIAGAEGAGIKLTSRVGRTEFPVPMSRKSVVSVGLTMRADDRNDLPLLSSSAILSFINGHYVCLQTLIRRDLITGELHLHDVATAALMRYSGDHLTQSFEPLVLKSLANTRVLGLFVPREASIEPQNLRTLVLIVGSPMLEAADSTTTRMEYELLFIHAVESKNSLGDDDLTLYAFLTSDRGATLHDLGTFAAPLSPQDCESTGVVRFTDYGSDGLTPIDSALRALEIHSARRFKSDELNSLLQAETKQTSWLSDPATVFRAIIKKAP